MNTTAKLIFLAAILLCISAPVFAQQEKTDKEQDTEEIEKEAPAPKDAKGKHAIPYTKRYLKHQITTLTSKSMAGRGYVNKGKEHAANYLRTRFREYKLTGFVNDSTYDQGYTFPVNTFPGAMQLTVNKKELKPGADYIIDAGSNSYISTRKKIKKIDLDDVADSAAWNALKAGFTPNKVYLLQHADSFCKRMNIRFYRLSGQLPAGCYIIPQHGKLTWTVETDTIAATIFYVEDTALPKHPKNAAADVKAVFKMDEKEENLAGYIPGEVKDSFIVFTAHYDHLGMMGNQTYFPGASDNASGTAMMLNLASYFSAHPQHYSIAFIAFSGEEAGLKGSAYFVKHPLFPLDHIKFLTNIDIMGDATQGITVVNATEFPKEFSLLQQVNEKKNWLPAIKSRGKAANSDHYFFTQVGVPSFFIYANGGKGYYHDIFDDAHSLSLENVDGVANLLIDFTTELQK